MRLGGRGKEGTQAGDRERREANQGSVRATGTGDVEVSGYVAYDPSIVTRKAEAAARKALPIWSGVMKYFPKVWAHVAQVSKVGNDQHNPGEPLHWSRGKSDDHLDSAFRHLLDYADGKRFDTDGCQHLAKAIWRVCAELQIDLERQEAEKADREQALAAQVPQAAPFPFTPFCGDSNCPICASCR